MLQALERVFLQFVADLCRRRLLELLPEDVKYKRIRAALTSQIESVKQDLAVLRIADLREAESYFSTGLLCLTYDTHDSEASASRNFELAHAKAHAAFQRVRSFEDCFVATKLLILCDYYRETREAQRAGLTMAEKDAILKRRSRLIEGHFSELLKKKDCAQTVKLYSSGCGAVARLSRVWHRGASQDILRLTYEAATVCARFTGVAVLPTDAGAHLAWARLVPPLILCGARDCVLSLALDAAAGRLYSGSKDGTIRVWRLDAGHEGECTHEFKGHTGGVESLALEAAAGRLFSCGGDDTIRVWRLDDGHEYECAHIFNGHAGMVWSLALHAAAGRLYSGGGDRTIRVCRLDAGHEGESAHVFNGHTGGVWSLALDAASGRLYSGSYDDTIRVWRLDAGHEGECAHVFTGHTGGVMSLALDPAAGRLYSGSYDGTIRVWCLDAGHEGECAHVFDGHAGWVPSLALHAASGRLYSGGGDDTIRVWRLDAGHEGECVHIVEAGQGWVRSFALDLALGRLYSGGSDGAIRVWHSVSMQFVQRPRRSSLTTEVDVTALLNQSDTCAISDTATLVLT
ncbi:hypothetical protein AB1Y20_014806 [Prymnesium parvum]|uniref:Uncharacterized protein n=1 Tax=Prymnesium parvum TaxID=97485 RepID=A0AB34IFA6_PRYPA